MKKIFRIVFWVIIFVLLTTLTQIGGLILIISLILSNYWKIKIRGKAAIIFVGLYIISTFLVIPFISPFFGREKIIHSDKIKPATFAYVLLNRNYVSPELNDLLLETEKNLINTEVEIIYLDANFPFLNGFPLLPHLSHNDGKKIDFSLIYENQNGEITNKTKSLSGYGVFASPKKSETNKTEECKQQGFYQYDFPKYFTFGKINHELKFSKYGTKLLIEALLKNNNLGKVFIEPHLKERLGLIDDRIRYHGCHSVRHDDHIHIQLK